MPTSDRRDIVDEASGQGAMSSQPFIDGLTVTDTIRAAMRADGIGHPTYVQTHAIPAVLAGKHAVMHSGTGTGKTLAYLLPVLQRLREGEGRAVVIAPGVELAMQSLRVAKAYKDPELKAAAAVSTSNSKRQRKRLQKSTRLVVGTPDRVIELFQTGKLKGTRILVLDEIDPILSSKRSEFLNTLLSRSEPKLQLIIATATLTGRSEDFIERFMPDAHRVEAPDAPMREAISHHVVIVSERMRKEAAIVRFIQRNRSGQVIVFASEARHQSRLFHELSDQRIAVVTVNRERTKQQRQAGLRDFRTGKARVLLTDDPTGRGLDVPNVAFVLHYDVPRAKQAYVHRAGRTGRAGQHGCSIVFADPPSRGAIRRLERQLEMSFTLLPTE